MTYYRISGHFLTARSGALLALMAAGFLAVVYRFSLGLGSTTGMTDQFPWGIWVGFDVLCGVAVTSGCFTTAAIVYLFFNRSCLGLVRPALLTAFLGYVFVVIGVLFDLGLPWMIWHPIVYWPQKSPMFLVAWCDMLLLATLGLMFLPAVFERYKLQRLQLAWQNVSSLYVVFSLTLFSFLMSRSLIWAGATFVIFTFLAIVTPRMFDTRPGSPILLLVAAIVFSIAHQTALGSLFLLMQDKLDHLWWTPILPLNFYLSAIPVGMAMVIFESTLSSRAFNVPFEEVPLRIMSKVLLYSLWVYLLVRMIDLIARGHLAGIFSFNGALFTVEITAGVLLPLYLFSRKSITHSVWPRFTAAALVILGLIINRFNVVMFGMERPGGGFYLPSIEEVLITCGIVATFLFFYNVLVRLFPIVEIHDPRAAGVGAIITDTDERTIAFSAKEQTKSSMGRTGSEGV